jgi:D-aminoacyl-tRNA deacylase
MVVLIVASKQDEAAQNIARELTRIKNFQPVAGSANLLKQGELLMEHVESDGIYTDRLNLDVKLDAVIFASRHRSESGEPALTVHWTGNSTSRADFGGKPKSLSYTDPGRSRAALLTLDALKDSKKINYTVAMEATHHGPTELGLPTLFVEIGSTEKEWNDPEAGAAAAEAIWQAATAPLEGKYAVGFGGGHYCNKQCAAVREDGYAFGHILSKYFFDEYDEQVVRMSFQHTIGTMNPVAVVDWKGIRGSERRKLIETLTTMNVEVVRV